MSFTEIIALIPLYRVFGLLLEDSLYISKSYFLFSRLCQLLEGSNSKQLFRTYEGLEQMAEKLHLDTMSVVDQLAVSSQEQILLSKMDADLGSLRNSMYCGGERVCLSNLVSNWIRISSDCCCIVCLIILIILSFSYWTPRNLHAICSGPHKQGRQKWILLKFWIITDMNSLAQVCPFCCLTIFTANS